MIKILMLMFELSYSFTFGYVLQDNLQIYETPYYCAIYFAEYEVEILVLKLKLIFG